MTKQQVVGAITEVIAEIQRQSGRECPKITSETIPIGGVPGFDSHNGLEATILIDERLGINTPYDARLFTDEVGHEAVCVGEIAQRIIEFAESREAVDHG